MQLSTRKIPNWILIPYDLILPSPPPSNSHFFRAYVFLLFLARPGPGGPEGYGPGSGSAPNRQQVNFSKSSDLELTAAGTARPGQGRPGGSPGSPGSPRSPRCPWSPGLPKNSRNTYAPSFSVLNATNLVKKIIE